MIPCFDIDRSIPFRLLVVSGFSGSGKGSVLDQFSEEQRTVCGLPIEVVTSYTTRQPRHSGEKYHFVTPQVFMDMVQTDQFLEYNDDYSNNSYGTPIQGVRDALRKGRIPCLEIDCAGLEKMLSNDKVDPGSVVSVFITASADELYDRLCKRGTETQEQIQKRLQTAIKESYHLSSYTYVLTNSVLSETVSELQKAFEGCLPRNNVFDDVQFRQDVKRILDTI